MTPLGALKCTWVSLASTSTPPWSAAAPPVRRAAVASRRYSAGGGTMRQRRQAERWLAATSASGGRAVVHASSTNSQRGAKMQPGGSSFTRGIAPGIVTSERFSGVGSKSGHAAEQVERVGVQRPREELAQAGLLR